MKLASMSGVSYGSIKRFETTGQISLISLTKIAMALDIADELRNIFYKCHIGIFRRLSMSETKTLQVMYDEKSLWEHWLWHQGIKLHSSIVRNG